MPDYQMSKINLPLLVISIIYKNTLMSARKYLIFKGIHKPNIISLVFSIFFFIA
jgi:hypothetical protein